MVVGVSLQREALGDVGGATSDRHCVDSKGEGLNYLGAFYAGVTPAVGAR